MAPASSASTLGEARLRLPVALVVGAGVLDDGEPRVHGDADFPAAIEILAARDICPRRRLPWLAMRMSPSSRRRSPSRNSAALAESSAMRASRAPPSCRSGRGRPRGGYLARELAAALARSRPRPCRLKLPSPGQIADLELRAAAPASRLARAAAQVLLDRAALARDFASLGPPREGVDDKAIPVDEEDIARPAPEPRVEGECSGTRSPRPTTGSLSRKSIDRDTESSILTTRSSPIWAIESMRPPLMRERRHSMKRRGLSAWAGERRGHGSGRRLGRSR